MKQFTFTTNSKKLLADILTPVSLYLKIRDEFPNSILLESSDYHSSENSFSFICFQPLASFKVEDNSAIETFPDGSSTSIKLNGNTASKSLHEFTQKFKVENSDNKLNGFFGYTSYNAIKHFDTIKISKKEEEGNFKGDDFNVYRALRSINPSPYLFYFDFGSFKLFGSSPEAQITINDSKASIHPIAGTFKRTGNDKLDREAAIELSKDPKENAEHTMLVDLARNDLSRNAKGTHVETYKEIQFYSHVIHLVSKVSGYLEKNANPIQIVADTFPAGTLSGAPKYKAMQLIDKIEGNNRGFYGGCIGYLGLNGDVNQAILIRSFMSKNNKLFYRAGAGVVDQSVEESELKEVDNKIGALRAALNFTEAI